MNIIPADRQSIAPLFDGWNEALIWSCIDGSMGCAYTMGQRPNRSAQIITGDFCFLAGEPCKELALNIPKWYKKKYMLIVPQNKQWKEVMNHAYGTRAKWKTRYAIKKEKDVFDKAMLEKARQITDPQYTIRQIDHELYCKVLQLDWAEDFCSQFDSWEHYRDFGLGFVVMCGGEPVAGASSYIFYKGGIEIEIDTHIEHRRKGLAYACGARLILECLERGLYPSWDAQNEISLHLAQRLGYRFDHEYDVCVIGLE